MSAATGRGPVGTGLLLLGHRRCGDRECHATIWAVLLFLPLVPLRTLVLRSGDALRWRSFAYQPRTARLDVLCWRRPDWRCVAAGYAQGVTALAVSLAPLAASWALVGEGSLIAPALLRLSDAGWLGSLVDALEAFEGALRLVLGAIWFALALAALDMGVWRVPLPGRVDRQG